VSNGRGKKDAPRRIRAVAPLRFLLVFWLTRRDQIYFSSKNIIKNAFLMKKW
jgi:hypothetical protein